MKTGSPLSNTIKPKTGKHKSSYHSARMNLVSTSSKYSNTMTKNETPIGFQEIGITTPVIDETNEIDYMTRIKHNRKTYTNDKDEYEMVNSQHSSDQQKEQIRRRVRRLNKTTKDLHSHGIIFNLSCLGKTIRETGRLDIPKRLKLKNIDETYKHSCSRLSSMYSYILQNFILKSMYRAA